MEKQNQKADASRVNRLRGGGVGEHGDGVVALGDDGGGRLPDGGAQRDELLALPGNKQQEGGEIG